MHIKFYILLTQTIVMKPSNIFFSYQNSLKPEPQMYTRNLRTVNADITEKDLLKLKCKFRNLFSRQIILGVIKKDYYEVMKRKSWLKDNGFYDWRLWKPVFNMLDEAPVERVYFTNYRNWDIIYDIAHVNFAKLRQLHIEANLITSIEPIVAIKAPHLRKLDMRCNLIMSIDCLRRCVFPELQELCLSDNFIISCVCIAECYFPNLRRLAIEQKYQPYIYLQWRQGVGQQQLPNMSSVNGYDMSWIIKLETSEIEHIKYSADERLIRRELEEQIGMKFYKVRVQKKGMDLGSLLPLLAF